MKKFNIQIETTAERDMREILLYISDTLKEPASALRIFNSIRGGIDKLAAMPEKNRILDEQPYAAIGVRRMLVENYIIFYLIDKQTSTVHILRVLYNRKEWQNIL